MCPARWPRVWQLVLKRTHTNTCEPQKPLWNDILESVPGESGGSGSRMSGHKVRSIRIYPESPSNCSPSVNLYVSGVSGYMPGVSGHLLLQRLVFGVGVQIPPVPSTVTLSCPFSCCIVETPWKRHLTPLFPSLNDFHWGFKWECCRRRDLCLVSRHSNSLSTRSLSSQWLKFVTLGSKWS
jgi:hypothetical protein